MVLYRVNEQKLEQVQDTSYANEKMLERRDLQRLLISNLSPLGDDLFLLTEEYGDWEDSNRRIDLLCLDKQKRLVVVEIKRTENGGHMELQAIRYAAMVSSMTLDQAISTHQSYLARTGANKEALAAVLEFLKEDSLEEVELTGDVRIILAAADFSQEITTSVMWLNKHDLDITCVRLKPYTLDGKVVIDVTQIIPLPEAEEYEIKIRAQAHETKKVQTAREDALRRFWGQFIEKSRSRTALFSGRTATKDQWISVGIGKPGFTVGVSLTESHGRVECFIRDDREKDREKAKAWSKAVFSEIEKHKASIEKEFGEPISWHILPERIGSRICWDMDCSWRSDEACWPNIQDQLLDALLRLEAALKRPIESTSQITF